MLRSLYSGVSGMKNQQTKLDVIANNIANVNTTAFKSGRVRFQDMLSQTIRSASQPMDNGRGGINPRQVGLGMEIAGIDTITNQGNPQSTGRPLDFSIQGDGYFILSPDGGTNRVYSRDGAFTLDTNFNLVNSDGYGVLGYDPSDVLRVNIAKSGSSGSADWTAADETTALSADSSITINGVQIQFKKDDTISTVLAKINDSLAGVTAELDGGLVLTSHTGSLKVESASGDFEGIKLNRAASSAPQGIGLIIREDTSELDGSGIVTSGIDWSKAKIDTPVDVASSKVSINGIDFTFSNTDATDPTTNTFMVTNLKDVADAINNADVGVKVDFLKDGGLLICPTNGNTSMSIGPAGGVLDDNEMGIFKGLNLDVSGIELKQLRIPENSPINPDAKISSYSVSADGSILGVYDDNSILNLGVISLAKFANPAGLLKIGGNNYTISNNSGSPSIGTGASGGRGDILQNTLEMSNVDLANEFTDMIITSRAFQANSRSITTSDEMLQELLNLKR